MPLFNEDYARPPGEQNPYLFFKAQRAWFSIGMGLEEDRISWTSCPACIIDTKGNVVGSIRLNVHRSDGPPVGETCELIALSLGAARIDRGYPGILSEWHMPNLPFNAGIYRFYFVLWIEWKEGIAYRKAIGTVFKDVWENQILEDIDIILG